MPTPIIYTPEVIAFLQKHWNIDKSARELAQELGMEETSLYKAVSRLRGKGYLFKKKGLPIGAVVNHRHKRGVISRVKTATGWKYMEVIESTDRKTGVRKPRSKVIALKNIDMPKKKAPGKATQLATDKNPMKIKQDKEGWRMVKTGPREWRLRPHGHVISFSGGRTSALMTIEMLKDEAYKDAVVIFANTGKENEATLEFVDKVDKLIGGRVIWIEYDVETWFKVVSFETASRNGEPFAALIRKRKYCPNRVARFCTQDLKIRPMKKYCQQVLGWAHWDNYVGIRKDEPRRLAKSKSVERNEVFGVVHILASWGVDKPQVLAYWKKMPFDLELLEHEGNCDLCFLKGKKKKQAIARSHPEKFDWWIQMEREVGGTFTPDYSYANLREWVKNAPEFDFDDSIECFCNVD